MKHCLFCKIGKATFMCCYALFCASFFKAKSTLVLIFILFACLNVRSTLLNMLHFFVSLARALWQCLLHRQAVAEAAMGCLPTYGDPWSAIAC